MAGKDAHRGHWPTTWRARVSAIAGLFVVAVVCSVVRYYWNAPSADAQAPVVPAAVRPAAATAPASSPAGARTAAPQVAAVVNGEPIDRQELARECLRRYGEEVLESVINKHLILQACQARNIVITPRDIEDEIVRLAGKFGLSPDRWLMLLESEREISPEQYRSEIVWPTIALRRLGANRLQVTDAEMQKAFESEYGPKVQVRMIALASAEEAEAVRAKALAAADDFGTLAKDHSKDANSAAARGLIPPIRMHVGDPVIERTIFGLRAGQISPVVHAANQYFVFKCERHFPATTVQPSQKTAVEQALRERLTEKKLREVADEIFAELQKSAKIVNVYNEPGLRQSSPGIAATLNGQQITMRELGEECIRRHGPEVLEGEIHRRLIVQALRKRNVTVTDADIDAEVARAARSYGFETPDGKPDVDAWLKKIVEQDGASIDLYVRDAVWPSVALKKLVGEPKITEEDLKKAFESNFGPRVEVLAIVLSNERTAQEVWEMARNHPTDKFFGELAHQYSIEPASRANYGQVPPIRRWGGQPTIEAEAFRLKPGELSGLIAAGDKFVVLRCLGRTTPYAGDFETVRGELIEEIREKNQRTAMTDELDRLIKTAQIDNFLAGTSQSGKDGAAVIPAGAKSAAPRTIPPAPTPSQGAAASSATQPVAAPIRR
jgi:parvulin-like peptidyl-prolyl isomerase